MKIFIKISPVSLIYVVVTMHGSYVSMFSVIFQLSELVTNNLKSFIIIIIISFAKFIYI